MAHGIMQHDIGFVWGSTWHHMNQYKELDVPVRWEQAHEALDFPLELVALKTIDDTPVDGFAIRRTDHKNITCPYVGKRFCLIQNVQLVDLIKIAVQETNLVVESTGSLFNGATVFLSLVVEAAHIQGDYSKTISRILFSNTPGENAYQITANTIRVVCNNTLRAALNDREKTSISIRHTSSAEQQIKVALKGIQSAVDGLKTLTKRMNILTTIFLSPAEALQLVTLLFPLAEGNEVNVSSRAKTINANAINETLNFFTNNDPTLDDNNQTSAYKVLNAYTYYIDHISTTRGSDLMATQWDGLMGQRARKKELALNTIEAFTGAALIS